MKKAAVQSILVALVMFALGVTAEAQQPKKVPRIGFLSLGLGILPSEEAFRQRLRKLGYIEGQNIVVEYRYLRGKSGPYTKAL